MNIKESFKNLTKLEFIFWLSTIILIFLSFIIFKNRNYLTLIASLIGATALIFVSKGNVLGQILTIVFSIVYGYISYDFKYYGELITYVGMSAPIAFFTMIVWLKNPYSSVEVKINNLSKIKVLMLFIFGCIITITFYFILEMLGNKNIIMSTISVLTTFLAVSLMFLRSRYYALAYAMNDIVLIILWVLASKEDLTYIPMIICFIIFLLNDLYGFINWTRMLKKQNKA